MVTPANHGQSSTVSSSNPACCRFLPCLFLRLSLLPLYSLSLSLSKARSFFLLSHQWRPTYDLRQRCLNDSHALMKAIQTAVRWWTSARWHPKHGGDYECTCVAGVATHGNKSPFFNEFWRPLLVPTYLVHPSRHNGTLCSGRKCSDRWHVFLYKTTKFYQLI